MITKIVESDLWHLESGAYQIEICTDMYDLQSLTFLGVMVDLISIPFQKHQLPIVIGAQSLTEQPCAWNA